MVLIEEYAKNKVDEIIDEFISKLANKLYNNEIPSYISSNIITLTKLDNNFNELDYNVNRIINNNEMNKKEVEGLIYTITNSTDYLELSKEKVIGLYKYLSRFIAILF